MSYWTEAKVIAASTLSTWRIIPAHLASFKKQVRTAVVAVGSAAGTVLAVLVCLVAPFFVWLAPALVPLRRRMIADEAQAREEAIARLTNRRVSQRNDPSK